MNRMLFPIAAVAGLIVSASAMAQTTPAYRSEPLEVMNYRKFLQAPKTAYNLNEDLDWQIAVQGDPGVFLAQDFEVRIFVVGPVASGNGVGAQPHAWTSVGNCRLFLSLVFPIDAASIRRSHELHVTSLDNDVRWLTLLDGRSAPTEYIAVFERRSLDQGPSKADFDQLGGRYEFLSLDASQLAEYFNRGLHFNVVPEFAAGVLQPPYDGERKAEVQFFSDAVRNVSWKLHCYHASPAFAAADQMEVADLEACKTQDLGAGPSIVFGD